MKAVKQRVFICDSTSWNAGQGTCSTILGCEICLCPDQNGIHKDQKRDLWLCISLNNRCIFRVWSWVLQEFASAQELKATAMWHGLLQSWNGIVERIAVPRTPSCVGCRQHAKQRSSVTKINLNLEGRHEINCWDPHNHRNRVPGGNNGCKSHGFTRYSTKIYQGHASYAPGYAPMCF